MQKKIKWRGFVAVIAASILFGCGYSIGSVIEASGMSKTCNSLWIALISIILNLAIRALGRKKLFQRITKQQLFLCIMCGALANWMSNFLFMVAYRYLSVPETTMLHFLHPSLIAVFMTIVYKERFSIAKALAIVCSITAMTLITGKMTGGSAIGITAAVMTGVCYAVYPVTLEVSPLKDVDSSTVILYMNITCVVCAALISAGTGTFSAPINAQVWMCDILSAVTNFFGYVLSAYAVSALGATNTSFGAMFEPIASCIIAVIFLGQPMQKNVFWAGGMVLLSVLFCSLNDSAGRKQNRICKKKPIDI